MCHFVCASNMCPLETPPADRTPCRVCVFLLSLGLQQSSTLEGARKRGAENVDYCRTRNSPAPGRSQPRVAGLGGRHVRVSQRVLCGAGCRGVAVRSAAITTSGRTGRSEGGGEEWSWGSGGWIVCRELQTVSGRKDSGEVWVKGERFHAHTQRSGYAGGYACSLGSVSCLTLQS